MSEGPFGPLPDPWPLDDKGFEQGMKDIFDILKETDEERRALYKRHQDGELTFEEFLDLQREFDERNGLLDKLQETHQIGLELDQENKSSR